MLDDVEFDLLELDENGNEVKVCYRGAWLLVDNGYLNWATTVAPFKRSNSLKELQWSEWVESMRKDIESTFGSLKGRQRILKTGIQLHGHEVSNKIWKTCCALNNWLLNIDGLSSQWEACFS